jgi:hypothetical protein
MSLRNSQLAVVFGILLAGGAFLRLLSGGPLVQTDLTYSAAKKEKLPGIKTPENTVRSFYFFIDNGSYEEAWNIILEPDWTEGESSVSYFEDVKGDPEGITKWTGKNESVKRLKRELGEKGSRLTPNNIEATLVKKVDTEFSAEITPLNEVKGVYKVRAEGHILGACSIFKWNREFYVVETRRGYRVLLNGTKGNKEFFYNSWIENIKKFGTIRGGKTPDS